MLALSGAPSTTSHLDINILSILHYLGSPLGLCTLIFDLMRNLFIYYAIVYCGGMGCVIRHGIPMWQHFGQSAITISR